MLRGVTSSEIVEGDTVLWSSTTNGTTPYPKMIGEIKRLDSGTLDKI